MVDVDRRLHVGHQAHIAGLKRLSARASQGLQKPTPSPRTGCFSFAPLAQAAIDRLRKGEVQVARGLTDDEFCRTEAPFAFTFPPDLKAILQEGLPVGAGFPDWRSGSLTHLRLLLDLPVAGLAYEVARGRFWLKHWGIKPKGTEQAVAIARAALRKAPLLIPVYRNCYIPSSPNLAGNPVFYVRQQEVFCCGLDLADFFEKQDFIQSEDELPCSFVDLDSPSVRALKSLQVPSSGAAKKCNGAGSHFPKKIENDEIDMDELTDCEYEERSGDLEGWGRNLDAMAKRNGTNAVNKRSFELLKNRTKAYRKHDHSVDLSNDHYASGRLASANFTQIARRIEFWSDLAEKRQINVDIFPSHEVQKSPMVAVDESEFRKSCISTTVNKDISQKQMPTPYWLERYFDRMATVLRNGGWKETDIAEIFDKVSPAHDRAPDLHINPQSIMQGLVLYVNLLSDVLRRAGWSSTDAAEALDVGLTFCEQRRRPSLLPPRVVAKIGKLAEYAARI